LSYISSGQRTMVSSGSSPMSSPTRDSFSSPCEEPAQNYEIRSRPNAAAILHRRKSVQNLSPFVETPRAVPPLPTAVPAQTPNFSVPRSANRHHLAPRPPPTHPEPVPTVERETNRLPRVRKPPPMSLRSTRPLSMVVDHPSPLPDGPSPLDGRPMAISHSPATDAPMLLPVRSVSGARSPGHTVTQSWQQAPSILSPRRMSSMSAIRRPVKILPEIRTGIPLHDTENHRTFLSPRAMQRASMHATSPQGVSRYDLSPAPITPMSALPPLRAPPPNAPLPPLPPPPSSSTYLTVEPRSKALGYRRSMPQLAMGPPAAPPPMCALPPIPQKHSFDMGSFI
jgi:hypothetical protein